MTLVFENSNHDIRFIVKPECKNLHSQEFADEFVKYYEFALRACPDRPGCDCKTTVMDLQGNRYIPVFDDGVVVGAYKKPHI